MTQRLLAVPRLAAGSRGSWLADQRVVENIHGVDWDRGVLVGRNWSSELHRGRE